MKEIATALVKAQKEFGPALKTSTNPHFQKKYADLAAVIEAVIDGLNNNGIALVQVLHECETGVTVSTSFIHESGEHIDCGKFHVPASKQDPQGYGSALTYARRYSLMAAAGIAPEDDDGNAASKTKKEAPKPEPKFSAVTPARMNVIADVAAAINERMASDDVVGAVEQYQSIVDAEEKKALWGLLDGKTKDAIKNQAKKA
ncbi:Essential recombination function protein [uncultured Caudovirales phage]|uniref:Essential recombination function protein n=1 Tax=uncultured Caudovirales phage TaxID=2100421 RepID=A0A6J5KHQ6_9CAUD|nr:Essential recombination function protein [uncultured Caudovirales phage]